MNEINDLMKIIGYLNLVLVAALTFGCGDNREENVGVEIMSKWSNGNVKLERVQMKGDTVEVISYHENFKINSKGKVRVVNGKDVKEGAWVVYYPDGRLWSKNVFSNGINNGEYRTWHTNGKPHIVGFYSNGSETGLWQFMDTLGVVVRQFDVTPGL
ncbi:MAG: hypothetical protein COA49_03555 [Bacteroidetes bacterium]|nr:MAG: hypothetical protein COA49_03555 [Bacteroidota bacterium]